MPSLTTASSLPVIHTLTGNLLAEYTQEHRPWTPGHTSRAQTSFFQVGGKGVNVAKMLHRLGHPTEALAFAGGGTGQDCRDWFARQPFTHRLWPSATPTRVGLVVRSNGQPETTFLGPDTAPDAAALNAMATHLRDLPAQDIVALCGSFPGWTSPDSLPLRTVLMELAGQGRLVADTYGPPLVDVAAGAPIVIKINASELRALHPAATTQTVPQLLTRNTGTKAAHTWIISDGPGTVWVARPDQPPVALTPPTVKEVSPTGSGDVLLAVWLQGHYGLGLDPVAATKRALPYASANAGHPGIADFPYHGLPTTISPPTA